MIKKRVELYIRVSTEKQAVEGYSISGQQERLKAFLCRTELGNN